MIRLPAFIIVGCVVCAGLILIEFGSVSSHRPLPEARLPPAEVEPAAPEIRKLAKETPSSAGEITKFDSTPGRRRRGVCARCGSTLTCEGARLPTETHFYVGAFDRAAELKPTRHVFPEEHLPWMHMDN